MKTLKNPDKYGGNYGFKHSDKTSANQRPLSLRLLLKRTRAARFLGEMSRVVPPAEVVAPHNRLSGGWADRCYLLS